MALGLAAVGMIYALQQVRVLMVRLEAQAQGQATFVAERVRQHFEQELNATVRAAARCSSSEVDRPCDLASVVPPWVGGVFRWDGEDLQALYPPMNGYANLIARATARLRAQPVDAGEENLWQRPELLYDIEGESAIALARTGRTNPLGTPIVIACLIQLGRLESDLIQPLLSPDMGLELVPSEVGRSSWSQPLFGVVHSWVLQPTRASIREQRNVILGQTLVYIALTLLALGTLLAAMWVLMRVVRREIRLAEMKANFVADVSHELKTPLALIRMFGETLQSGRVQDEEKRQEYYGVITRESTRLTNLINNILDFAKINAGYKTYAFERTDVGAVIRQTFEAYRPQLDHNGFEHQLTVEESLPEVAVDQDAIAQALINLIQNAIKYSGDDRYLAIDVAQDVRRDRHGVLISVHDRGIGIHPQDRGRVFQGFFRARDGRVAKQGGAGLGLALVKHIVDAHGGTLDVESRLVKGSTFRIFLPASERRPVHSRQASPAGPEEP